MSLDCASAGNLRQGDAQQRRRVLAISYACHPTQSAESRVGWARVMMASKRRHVTVLCEPTTGAEELKQLATAQGVGDEVQFVSVPHSYLSQRLYDSELFYLAGYRMWHHRVLEVAKQLHASQPFDLVHQVNFCGYREPGYGWQLGVPFVWGPIGGTQNFPTRYLSVVGPLSGAREVARNVVNRCQLRFSRRLRKAFDASSQVLAATQTAQRDLRRRFDVDLPVELEAGLEYSPAPLREPRDINEPIRVLWTGQLRAWKGLPLLLRALARLPEGVRFTLRVQGEGRCEAAYRRLAARLGIAGQIEWLGWGPYPQTLPHYDWADIFAFTSLRDTSGAGLLEALAAGAPVITLDHQGASDIVDETCGLQIPPRSPSDTVRRFADAIAQLATDSQLHLRLSHGASRRAEFYEWRRREEVMEAVYQRAFHSASRILGQEADVLGNGPFEPTAEAALRQTSMKKAGVVG